jgi:hypothetical protein
MNSPDHRLVLDDAWSEVTQITVQQGRIIAPSDAESAVGVLVQVAASAAAEFFRWWSGCDRVAHVDPRVWYEIGGIGVDIGTKSAFHLATAVWIYLKPWFEKRDYSDGALAALRFSDAVTTFAPEDVGMALVEQAQAAEEEFLAAGLHLAFCFRTEGGGRSLAKWVPEIRAWMEKLAIVSVEHETLLKRLP